MRDSFPARYTIQITLQPNAMKVKAFKNPIDNKQIRHVQNICPSRTRSLYPFSLLRAEKAVGRYQPEANRSYFNKHPKPEISAQANSI